MQRLVFFWNSVHSAVATYPVAISTGTSLP